MICPTKYDNPDSAGVAYVYKYEFSLHSRLMGKRIVDSYIKMISCKNIFIPLNSLFSKLLCVSVKFYWL